MSVLGKVVEFGLHGAVSRGIRPEESHSFAEQVEAIVKALPDGDRKAVRMHYFNWQPLRVSARRLGITEDAMKQALYRARRRVELDLLPMMG